MHACMIIFGEIELGLLEKLQYIIKGTLNNHVIHFRSLK